jgi:hypothetical protein
MPAGGGEQHFLRGTRVSDGDHRNSRRAQRRRQGVVWDAWCGIGQQRQVVDNAHRPAIDVDDIKQTVGAVIAPPRFREGDDFDIRPFSLLMAALRAERRSLGAAREAARRAGRDRARRQGRARPPRPASSGRWRTGRPIALPSAGCSTSRRETVRKVGVKRLGQTGVVPSAQLPRSLARRYRWLRRFEPSTS